MIDYPGSKEVLTTLLPIDRSSTQSSMISIKRKSRYVEITLENAYVTWFEEIGVMKEGSEYCHLRSLSKNSHEFPSLLFECPRRAFSHDPVGICLQMV